MFQPIDREQAPFIAQDSQIRTSDWKVLAAHWHPVAAVPEVGDQPLPVRLLDVDLVLFRSDGNITAALDMCPHRWVRLSAGEVVDGRIVCPFHGLAFDGEGRCVRVPALGREAKLPERYRVKTFPVVIRYGLVWVLLDAHAEETVPDFPAFSNHDESAFIFFGIADWPMSAARQIENFFDLAHLPFVHETTLGGEKFGRIDPAQIEEREKSAVFRASYLETVPFPSPTVCHLSYEVFFPFAIEFASRPETGGGFVSINIASPKTASTCRVFQLGVRGEPGEIFEDGPLLQLPEDGPGLINQQDIDVLSTLRFNDLPLTEKLELHLPVDNVSAVYRRRLRDLGLGRP